MNNTYSYLVLLLFYCVAVASITRDPPCAASENDATCKFEGNKIETFDGIKYQYDLCNHALVRNVFNNKWKIDAYLISRLGSYHLEITQKNKQIYISSTPNSGDYFYVEYEGYNYTIEQANIIGLELQEFSIHRNGRGVFFKSSLYGFWIDYYFDDKFIIGVPEEMSNKINGLCGKYNDNPEDDTTKSDGNFTTSAHEFGDSWKLNKDRQCLIEKCTSENRQKALEMCSVLRNSNSFALCSDVIDIEYCLNDCIADMCSCFSRNGDNCACEAKENFAKKCQEKSQDINLDLWREEHKCSQPECPNGLIYKECYTRQCEISCENLHYANACPEVDTCYSGCYCPDGLIRKGSKCVAPKMCKDCHCEWWGDPHYTTYDGTTYDFQGKCTYVASRSKTNNSTENSGFEVLVTNEECGAGVTCATSVTILYDNHIIRMGKAENDVFSELDGRSVLNIPMKNTWLAIEKESQKSVTILILKIQLEVTFFLSSKFVIRLPSQLYSTDLEGLCGNCNGYEFDDLIKSDSSLTSDSDDFGMSWLSLLPGEEVIEHSCLLLPSLPSTCAPGYPVVPSEDLCLTLLNSEIFGKCHNLVDPGRYIEQCKRDMCHSNDRDSVPCSAMAAYAQACQMNGLLCLDWRTNDLCPYTCPQGQIYKPCGSGCELTCTNFQQYLKDPNHCEMESIEGCFCPDGFVLSQGYCVKPEEGCKDCTCGGWGDPHYTTFDDTVHHFQGECTYVAVRESRQQSEEGHIFQVLVTNKAYEIYPHVSVTVGVIILYMENIVHVHRELTENTLHIEINSEKIVKFPLKNEWIRIEHQHVSTQQEIAILYIPAIQLEVTLSEWTFSIKVASYSFKNNFEGLCGNCNGNRDDDFIMRNGTLATNWNDFGMSWFVTNMPLGVAVEEKCNFPLPPPTEEQPSCLPGFPIDAEIDPCLAIMDVTKFGECHHLIDPTQYVTACQFDMCHTGDDTIGCKNAEAYAAACRNKGICLEWRSEQLCPFNCAGGSIYKACESGCTVTCDNYNYIKRDEIKQCGLEKTEGCHCPKGQVFEHGVCIPHTDCNTCDMEEMSCKIKNVPSNDTGGMITETHAVHGKCVSKPANGYKQCSGFCNSKSIYSKKFGDVVTEGSCCKMIPSKWKWVDFVLTCEDGYEYARKLKTPTACKCDSCT